MVLQIHAIYKVERKPDMVLQLVEPRSLGGPRNKLWLRHLQIMHKLLRFTKHVKNVCGLVNELPHTRIKWNSQRERANENILRRFGMRRSTQGRLYQERQNKAHPSKIFLVHKRARKK